MSTERARLVSASQHIKRILLGNVCVLAVSAALAVTASPAAAKTAAKHKRSGKETEHTSKEPFGKIPSGPLQIFVSIKEQKLHLYSDGQHVADALVATGVPGHLTPLGVFSIIERDRYHHSNIYDNAPMPYMERITWSGVALHQGPGVGRQASHGCIRMPQEFAAKLWNLHTIGARVIIANPELRPVEFTDPHLFVHKDRPATVALPHGVETAQAATPGTRTDVIVPLAVAAAAQQTHNQASDPAPAGAAAKTDKPGAPAPDAAAPAPAQIAQQGAQTPPASQTPGTASAAAAKVAEPPQGDIVDSALIAGVGAIKSPPAPAEAAPAATPDQSAAPAKAEAAPAPAPAQAAAPAQPEPAAASTAAAPSKAAEPIVAEPAKTEAAKTEATKTEPANNAVIATPAPSGTATPTPAAKAETSAVPGANLTAPVTAVLEDVPLPPSKPSRIARSEGGPIAIFVSRKTARIYVRQNFMPVFDAPVTIEHADQPLGTHVFTAMDFLPDHSTLRWNVVTLPGSSREVAEHWKYVKDAKGHRRRERVEEKVAEPASPPPSPQDVLARIEIPQDVIDQISQLIGPGSSLVVSDQGLGSETGSGTDFIVVTR